MYRERRPPDAAPFSDVEKLLLPKMKFDAEEASLQNTFAEGLFQTKCHGLSAL